MRHVSNERKCINITFFTVLAPNNDEVHISPNISHCGPFYCPQQTDMEEQAYNRPTDEVMFRFVTVLCLICAVAMCLVMVGIDKLRR